jgi:hypothetical protein
MLYYFASGMEQRGPYSLEELADFGLRPDTLVWREGMENWQRLDTVAELVALTPKTNVGQASAPAAQTTVPPPPEPLEQAPAPVPYSAPSPALAPLQNTTWNAGYPQYPVQYQSALAQPPSSGMAIASMILGIVSLLSFCLLYFSLFVGLPSSILAIVFGVLARQKIARDEQSGRGMALAGIICGSTYLGLLVVGVIIVLIYIAASMR